MTGPASFRRAEPSDAEALLGLATKIHGHVRSMRHWEWKFLHNPAGPILTSVAEVDGKLVGQVASFPVRLTVRGDVHRASQEVDIFVDEEHRPGSTFFRLYKNRLEINRESNVDLIFGITIAVTSRISEKVMKCRKVAPVPRLVKLLDAGPFLRRKLPVRPLAALASAIVNRAISVVPAGWDTMPEGTCLEPVTRFDERFDALWRRVQDDYAVRFVKDSNYLNWRYCDIPDEKYETIALVQQDSAKVLGFVVLACKNGGLNRGRIVDLVTPRADKGPIARPLLAHTLRRFRETGMSAAVCWMFPHCHVYPLLERAGFHLRETEGHDVVVRVMEHADPASVPWDVVQERRNWYIVQGDSDDY